MKNSTWISCLHSRWRAAASNSRGCIIKKLAIAAVSARAFVGAAQAAGYSVTAMDAFADSDTQQIADHCMQIAYANGGFEAACFIEILKQLPAEEYQGLVYGSGFEAQPRLLELAAQHMPLIGNTPRVLRSLKRARQLSMLLSVLGLPQPEVRFQPLPQAAGWLQKSNGGSGGTHISRALPNIWPGKNAYFQREIPGTPVSLLFAADGRQARAIGCNRLWSTPAVDMPYRYGGAVSHAVLPSAVQQQLQNAAQQLTNAVGLRGLNSLDAIVNGEQMWLLEVNPRLTATVDLYQVSSGNLLKLHIESAAGDMRHWPVFTPVAKAQQIVYLPFALSLPAGVAWPQWVADRPAAAGEFAAGSPLCSVHAEAETADEAQALAQARALIIEQMIENHRK